MDNQTRQSKNQLLISSIQRDFENEDLESIKEKLPTVLKAFSKIDSRMDRILNQSDTQQLEMLKLKEKIEQSNNRISTLLNNAGQGFLYFDQNMSIGAEYSKEAKRIFDRDIENLNITTLLYKDQDDANFLKGTLQSIL